jgi:hypothetical protein
VYVDGHLDCPEAGAVTGGNTPSTNLDLGIGSNPPPPVCYAPDDPIDLKLARAEMWLLGFLGAAGGARAASLPSGAAGNAPFVPGTWFGGPGSPNSLVTASLKVPPSASSSGTALPAPASPAGLLAPTTDYNQWEGPPTSIVLPKDMTMYRAWGTNAKQVGSWLSVTRPPSAVVAQSTLALKYKPEYVSEVLVPAGTRIQIGWAAAQPTFGQPGQALQVRLLDRIPDSNFGPGIPLP